jgi:hypothetical protein
MILALSRATARAVHYLHKEEGRSGRHEPGLAEQARDLLKVSTDRRGAANATHGDHPPGRLCPGLCRPVMKLPPRMAPPGPGIAAHGASAAHPPAHEESHVSAGDPMDTARRTRRWMSPGSAKGASATPTATGLATSSVPSSRPARGHDPATVARRLDALSPHSANRLRDGRFALALGSQLRLEFVAIPPAKKPSSRLMMSRARRD